MLVESNLWSLQINFLFALIEEEIPNVVQQVLEKFVASPCSADILYALQHLKAPLDWPKTKAQFLKLKAVKFCFIDQFLYWKDLDGMLLNFLLGDEAQTTIKYFNKGDCGSHLYWNTTKIKILRACLYWPSLFADAYKKVASCKECQMLKGRKKLLPLPLKHIAVESPFQ